MNPELRFKDQDGNEFPDWEEKKLKNICIFVNGKGHEQVISQYGKYIVVNSKFVSTDGEIVKYSNEQLEPLFKDDIVMVMSDVPNGRAIAKFFYIDEDNKYSLNQRICAIRTNQNQMFIMKQLNRHKYFLAFDDGAKQTNLKKEDVLKCPVFIPDIEEQSKIAALLSDIDKKIESQAALVEKLKNTKDAMFVKMFPQGDNVNPTLRFKKEDGSNYADWGKEKLNKIASPKARIGWQGMRQSEFLDFGDFYLITGTDFDNGSINFDTCCYVEKYRYDQDKNIQVHNGDILITKDGTLGKVAYISNMDKPATLNAGVFVLNNLDEKMDSLFLYHYLAAPFLMEYANQQATGGTIKHLNQKVLVSFEIPIPDKEEQIKIGKCLSDLDKEIEINQQKYEKLCDVKKALLSKLFPTKEDE